MSQRTSRIDPSELKHNREIEWKCNQEVIQQLTQLSSSSLNEYTKFIYQFISYNTLYSYLKDTPQAEFVSDNDAVGKPVIYIQKKTGDGYQAATIVPCYLGHRETAELLMQRSLDINKIIQSIWTKENPDRPFTIFLKGKGKTDFWEKRARNDFEHIELIEYYLGERPNLSGDLEERLAEPDGKISDGLFCESILALMYQVRCNLFHGSKKSIDKQEMALHPMNSILNKLIEKTVNKIGAGLKEP